MYDQLFTFGGYVYAKNNVRDTSIEPGDTYYVEGNDGNIYILTCKEWDKTKGYIVPVETAYLFNDYKCHRRVGTIKWEESYKPSV